MKTSTHLGRSLVLVALLAVSWAGAAPLVIDPEKEDVRDEVQAFLDQNPAIAEDLYPELLDLAYEVNITVNQEDLLDLLDGYVREATVEEIEEELEREEEEEELEKEEEEMEMMKEEEELEKIKEEEYGDPRKKRQTLLGNLHRSSNAYGKSIQGSLSLSHSSNNGRHSFSGNIGAAKHTINGLGSAKSYSAGVGYKYSPNKKTSFGISAHKIMSPGGGSSNAFGLSFSHKFGR
ncbi:kinesin-related protein 12-like [Portunus trituberculatus]|nr:kinesin-related protein 12-like [Portunus trituberculatus]